MVYLKFSDSTRSFYTTKLLREQFPQYVHVEGDGFILDPIMIAMSDDIVVIDDNGDIYWAKKNGILTDGSQNLTPEEKDEFLIQMLKSTRWPT